MIRLWVKALVVLILLAVAGMSQVSAKSFVAPSSRDPAIVGRVYRHAVRPGETLLDIARKYDMGITELQMFYPTLDPWLLEEGSVMQIPALWILPATKGDGIVINVPELRLYYFLGQYASVWTYPVTVGEKETPTPVGKYRVVDRAVDPTWNIPERLQHKYKQESMPPGKDNPIGKYWLGLSRERYGIHGTDNAWSVGRIISNGCIRLYPEDMEMLYPEAPLGTPVSIVYQPVKFGFMKGKIFIEVHEDIYGRIKNMDRHARSLAKKMRIEGSVDWEEVHMALHEKSGVPVPVGALPEGGGGEQSSRHR